MSLQFGGMNRSYILYIPAGYDGAKRLPLVFDVHGLSSWADEQLTRSKWGEMADKEGFVLIEPDGVNKSWNAGSCCGSNTQDDVGFFREMVEKATAELCIDSKRVYVSGHSNGGAMTYRLVAKPRISSRRSPGVRADDHQQLQSGAPNSRVGDSRPQ